MLSQLLKNTIDKHLPRRCPLCELSLRPTETHWCSSCLQWFNARARCARCGLPSLSPVDQCGACLTSPPSWQRLYCLGDYTYPLSAYVHQIKHHRQFWHISPLCQLLADRISSPAPLLIPVPLHWQRYLLRGFNQSTLIAHHLSRYLHQPYDNHVMKRHRATQPQQGQSRQARQENLHHAFNLRYPPSISHVAIVDDVVTTGSTINQLCQLLLEVGIERIDIYCLCRTAGPSMSA